MKSGVAYLVAFVLALCVLAGATHAQPPNLVDHNGSLMAVLAGPRGFVRIEYVRPRVGVALAGVRPGTLLFEGQWDASGTVVAGTAFVFGPCGPVPYAVTGGVDPNNVLVLQGPAPIIGEFFPCPVLGMAITGNSTLVFVPVRP